MSQKATITTSPPCTLEAQRLHVQRDELLAALEQQVALTRGGRTDDGDSSERCYYCREFAYSIFEHHKADCEWRLAHEKSFATIARAKKGKA